MISGRLLFVFAALSVLGVLVAHLILNQARTAAGPRLVILYATCTLNKSFLSPYNENVRFTPELERLRRRSTVFQRHQTETGHSGPAFASIFSGTQMDRHGVFSHPSALPDSLELITEAYRKAGFDVYSWLNHGLASAELNYAQGVDPDKAATRILTVKDPVFESILERLKADAGYRAFLVTNFTITHGPYDLRHIPDFCTRFPEDCASLPGRKRIEEMLPLVRRGADNRALSYDFRGAVERLGLTRHDIQDLATINEIAYKSRVHLLDRHFGRLVAKIEHAGLLSSSLISFTADHGEVLFRENAPFKWTHGLQQAPEVLSVPWILWTPDEARSMHSYEAVSRSIDVFPTMAAMSGISPGGNVDGRDLSPALRSEGPEPHLLAFSHSMLPGSRLQMPQSSYYRLLFPSNDPELMWVSVRDLDLHHKLARPDGGEFENQLFDLAEDPLELTNIFDPENSDHRHMAETLSKYKRHLVSVVENAVKDREGLPEARQLELLRDLGYVE